MIVKLNKAEQNTLAAMDYAGRGPRNWINAREVASKLFRKKEKLLTQGEIRVVRNAFRRLVRESVIDKGDGDKRGMYRVTDKGRKMRGQTEFDSIYTRGEISSQQKSKSSAKKARSRRKSKSKSAKTKCSKSISKKTKKSRSSKPKEMRKVPPSPFTVEDKSGTVDRIRSGNGHGKDRPARRKFKRRNFPVTYGDSSNN